MRKKVNITRDLESRWKIAQRLPAQTKTRKSDKATPYEPPTTQTGTPPAADVLPNAAGSDKKSGRKAERNP